MLTSIKSEFPNAIDHDSRICFGIVWFATEGEADAAHKFVRKRGDYYNGGYMHGMACGRDSSYDKRNEAGEVTAYAVTKR
jgi:hypothetical protein